MTWTLHLTPWALAPVLAVLIAARDAAFLWPRRRERGGGVMLAFSLSVAAWAALALSAGLSTGEDVPVALTGLTLVPASAAAITWAAFGNLNGGRRRPWHGWPMLLLYAASGAGIIWGLAAASTQSRSLAYGSLEGLRAVAVLAGSWVTARHLATAPGFRAQAFLAGLAAVVALAPSLGRVLSWPGPVAADLSPTSFAMAGALLVWGLLRPRLLHLGPVDREVVLRELRDPLVVMDGRGRIVDANLEARNALGLLPYGEVPLVLGRLWAAGPPPKGSPAQRVELRDGSHRERTFEVTVTPLGDDASRRSVLLLRDVTVREAMRRDLERANAELELLARTDALTGLANRRHFLEALETEVERARRYARPLSVVLLDLDHFKAVNDTHGHAAGDAVLREAAEALRSVCRDVDLAARIGGEELALLLPETDGVGAATVAERVRQRIAAQSHISPDGDPFSVTASVGVATAEDDVPSGESLLHASDEALYRAKEGGRNRVEFSGR